MNNQTVAQRFAEGKTKATGSNMFIEGNTIYSYGYHFKIAVRFDDIVLFNSKKYSSSTGRHQSKVESELISHNIKYIVCPDCELTKALDYLTDQKALFELKQSRARKSDYSHEIGFYDYQLLSFNNL